MLSLTSRTIEFFNFLSPVSTIALAGYMLILLRWQRWIQYRYRSVRDATMSSTCFNSLEHIAPCGATATCANYNATSVIEHFTPLIRIADHTIVNAYKRYNNIMRIIFIHIFTCVSRGLISYLAPRPQWIMVEII